MNLSVLHPFSIFIWSINYRVTPPWAYPHCTTIYTERDLQLQIIYKSREKPWIELQYIAVTAAVLTSPQKVPFLSALTNTQCEYSLCYSSLLRNKTIRACSFGIYILVLSFDISIVCCSKHFLVFYLKRKRRMWWEKFLANYTTGPYRFWVAWWCDLSRGIVWNI